MQLFKIILNFDDKKCTSEVFFSKFMHFMNFKQILFFYKFENLLKSSNFDAHYV